MSHEICATVRVKSDNEFGFKVINASDVTADDVLVDAPAAPAEAPVETPAAPEAATTSWSK